MDAFIQGMIPGMILAVPLGLIPAAIAHRKGQNFWAWWIFGATLWIVALPLAILIKPTHREAPPQAPPDGRATWQAEMREWWDKLTPEQRVEAAREFKLDVEP
jgi:hypothetical protein